jgi:uncharacterized protein (DUF983 family)
MSIFGFLGSVATNRCPHCRQTSMFHHGPFSLQGPLTMKDACEKCTQPFELEQGFYYGAMFIGYIMSGFTALGIGAFALFVLQQPVFVSIGIMVVMMMLTYTIQYRLARSLWLHIFVTYGKDKPITPKWH